MISFFQGSFAHDEYRIICWLRWHVILVMSGDCIFIEAESGAPTCRVIGSIVNGEGVEKDVSRTIRSTPEVDFFTHILKHNVDPIDAGQVPFFLWTKTNGSTFLDGFCNNCANII